MNRRRRTALAALIVVWVLAACGADIDRSPAIVDDDDVPFGLLTTPSTQQASSGTISATAIATTVCFHLGPSVTTVTRPAPRPGVGAALDALLEGPSSDEQAAGLSTAVFAPDVVLAASVNAGVATVELAPGFADAGPSIQLDVIVEVVCTLTAQPGVGQVVFELRGERIEVPRGDGSLTAEPVSRDDFPELGP